MPAGVGHRLRPPRPGPHDAAHACWSPALLTLASALAWTPLSLGVLRGLAGGFFGAAYPSALIYLGDTVAGGGPAARHRPADGRGRDRHRARLGRRGGARRRRSRGGCAFVVTGAASLVLAVGCCAGCPSPGATRRPGRRSSRRSATVARSRVTLLVLLFAFAEGAVLLGALTLLPPAVENAGATAAVAGAVTGVYGVSVFLGSRLVGRLSPAWHPSRLIVLGAGAAVAAARRCSRSRRSPPAAVAVGAAARPGVDLDALVAADLGHRGAARRRGPPSCRSSPGRCSSAARWPRCVVADLADAGRYDVIYAGVRGARRTPRARAPGWRGGTVAPARSTRA